MAIFKKLLVSGETNSSPSRKISTDTANISTSFAGSLSINSQQQQSTQQQDATSTSNSSHDSSINDQTPVTGKLNQDGLEDICWNLYNQTLRNDQIRLTVFSEKDSRLLFDSETVISVSDRLVPGSHRSQCGRFQFLPHKYDTLRIAKMLFGTLPALGHDSMKIHTLEDVNSIMISRVFYIPKQEKYTSSFKSSDLYKCIVGSLSSDSDNQSNYSTIRSLEGIIREDNSNSSCGRFPLSSSKTFANPDPPERFNRVRNSSLQLDSNNIEDIMEELRAFSPNRLSRNRRRQLSQVGLDDCVSLRLNNRSRLSSCSSIAEACGLSESSTEWKQYGFSLILPGSFRAFVFQHILQIEREMERLVIQIHRAVQEKSQFFQLIHEGWSAICESLCLLCNSLRLKSPVWLGLISMEPERKEFLAANFCRVLTQLIHKLDTKDTKFFFSTAISAVLMNHSNWVASVAPPEKCSYDRSLLLGTSVIDTKQMPYNPTMAQLLELYSGIGIANGGESRFTKVVVLGDDPRLVAEMLSVLSYFIRCSSVESRQDEVLTTVSINGTQRPICHDFGRSLLAGVGYFYSPHFVLSGIDTNRCSVEDVLCAICEDVRHPMGEPCENSLMTLSPSTSQTLATNEQQPQHSKVGGTSVLASPESNRGNRTNPTSGQHRSTEVLACKSSPEKRVPREERRSALVLVIDTQHHTVKIVSSENCHVEENFIVCPSEAISSMMEEFAELYAYKCASDFLLSFLEDRLGSLLAKSSVLINLITTSAGGEPLSMERVSSILDADCSDLRLILNIAAVSCPSIIATVL